ncbi:hypothetical protein ACXVWQ_10790, partial [Haemophilus sp. SZY H57]
SPLGGKEVGSSKEKRRVFLFWLEEARKGRLGGLGGFNSWRIVAHTTFKRRREYNRRSRGNKRFILV